MNRVFVDSSVWIDHLRGNATPQTATLRALLNALDPAAGSPEPPEIVVGDLVLFEVLRGVRGRREHAAVLAMLRAFVQVDLGGADMALAAAAHYRRLRDLGVTIRKSIDCLIAAWCIENGLPLLHSDRDFEPFVAHCGLLRFDPSSGSMN